MRKSKEQLGLMAFKLTDTEYAQLATQATLLNASMGAVLRQMIRKLPAVTLDVTLRWAAFRKRSGHERLHMSLEELEHRLTLTQQPEDGTKSVEQVYLETLKEEMIKDAQETQAGHALPSLEQRPSMVEMAELQEAAENGDVVARERLEMIEKKFKRSLKTTTTKPPETEEL